MSSAAAKPRVVWNPGDYANNSESQLAWARELIATLKLKGDERVLDIGCGDGKITAELARALPRGSVTGIDASEDMIGFARTAFPESRHPNLRFHLMDARRIELPFTFDIAFSNAALHWVDDHCAVLEGISKCLAPGGRLVVSCGGKGNAQAVFDALKSRMRAKAWNKYFRRLERPYFFHSPDDYALWLPRCGFQSRRVRLVPKDMVFENVEKFSAWIRTTWLPYTQRVPESDRNGFVTEVVDKYLTSHPLDESSAVHVRMVRLEIDAVKV